MGYEVVRKEILTQTKCVENRRIGFGKAILPIPATDPLSRLAGEQAVASVGWVENPTKPYILNN